MFSLRENRRPHFGGEQNSGRSGCAEHPTAFIMPYRADFVNRCRREDAKFHKTTDYFYFFIFLQGGCKSQQDVVKYILL